MKAYPHRLLYTAPPPRCSDAPDRYPDEDALWEAQALPLGAGAFGACLYGYPDEERIQITENSLANPYFRDDERAPAKRFGLQGFAEIFLETGHTDVTEYRRTLDLDRGLYEVSYCSGGVGYHRLCFTSYPHRVLVCRLTADRKRAISLRVRLSLPYLGDFCLWEGDGFGRSGEVIAEGDTIIGRGVMHYYGIKYEGILRLLPMGGSLTRNGDALCVQGADEVVLLFSPATSYRLESRVFTEPDPKHKLSPYPHPHEVLAARIEKAVSLGYEALLKAHLDDYKRLFDRVDVALGTEEELRRDLDIPTDQLLAEYRGGRRSAYLETLLYHYGRYLLIASSRPDCLPANLQGVWCRHRSSPWSCGYWHNINVQMNYWPTGIANLAECFLPYIAYNQAYLPAARALADTYIAENYPDRVRPAGQNGWIIGTGAWPYRIECAPKVGHSGPGTGAFTSLLFWDYYEYTGDRAFLREIAYPLLYELSRFFSLALIEHEGKLLVEHSASPENVIREGEYQSYHTVGCAFDQQMVYENYRRTLEAAALLGEEEDDLLTHIRESIGRLDPVLIGEDGQVKEYREERKYGDIGEYHHRHISQLVGLYPGTIINETTPEWLTGARITLNFRGDRSTGWAAAHRLCLWARAKDGDRAMDLVRSMLRNNILPNLWDTHPPFQIDGNFGYVAGVSEMLLQSRAGYIDLLPALPSEWGTGAFRGLIAVGNFEVSATFAEGRILNATIVSRIGSPLRLRMPTGYSLERNGQPLAATPDAYGIVSLATAVGDIFELNATAL